MKNTVIVVGPSNTGADTYEPNPRFLFPGAQDWSDTVTSGEPETHKQGWERKVKVWVCNDKDVKHAVEQLTKWHGDEEIAVYRLETVYYRTPGTLESKAVTKDGVLPF